MNEVPDGPLKIELVPATAWGSNLRQLFAPREWQVCRWWAIADSRYPLACTICGQTGPRGRVECHEVWDYQHPAGMSLGTGLQVLTGLVALCPDCHHCKHLGYLMVTGNEKTFHRALAHLMAVNGWDLAEAEQAVDEAFSTHAVRSAFQWDLDITWLRTVLGDQLDLSCRQLRVSALERKVMSFRN